jgi:hypothetical protein
MIFCLENTRRKLVEERIATFSRDRWGKLGYSKQAPRERIMNVEGGGFPLWEGGPLFLPPRAVFGGLGPRVRGTISNIG